MLITFLLVLSFVGLLIGGLIITVRLVQSANYTAQDKRFEIALTGSYKIFPVTIHLIYSVISLAYIIAYFLN